MPRAGGVIEAITGAPQPRVCRVTRPARPSDQGAAPSGYFQRCVATLPPPGQMVLFDPLLGTTGPGSSG